MKMSHITVVWLLIFIASVSSWGVRFTIPRKLRRPPKANTAVSFYKFTPISDDRIEKLIPIIEQSLSKMCVKGTVYLANEGYNGQCAIESSKVLNLTKRFIEIDSDVFGDIELNEESQVFDASKTPYSKLIVRRKGKALSDGLTAGLNWTDCGTLLQPAEWQHELHQRCNGTSEPLLLDCRNNYESDEGSFSGAIPLNTTVFSESFAALDNLLNGIPKERQILTYCTGGIRCVKVNAYLKQKLGFKNVGRLGKGIIGYDKWRQDQNITSLNMNEAPTNFFIGRNFIFNKSRMNSNITESVDKK